MKKLKLIIFIIIIANTKINIFSQIPHIEGPQIVNCYKDYLYVGKVYKYASYGDRIVWKITNGMFEANGKTVLSEKITSDSPMVYVKWDSKESWGCLEFQFLSNGGIYTSGPFNVTICDLNNVYTIVKCDEFNIESDIISIPTGKAGAFTLHVQSWYGVANGNPDYEIKTFRWMLPPSSGGSTFYSNGKATLVYDAQNGDNEKVQIIPEEEKTWFGTPTILTIERFNGEVKNKTITSKRVYNWSDIYVENVTIKKDANVVLNGYNSVRILPGFTAESGSTVRIYNGVAPKSQTRSLTDEEAKIDNNINTDILAAKLDQNYPSPARTMTTIPCTIPEEARSAYIHIYNLIGVLVMKIPISSIGQNTIDINTSGLTNGIYMYSLIIDGNMIDTKRMIVSN